jgi:hypothetical protein
MDVSFYQMRIASIDEAAKRNRWVFAISIIASIAILGSIWNGAPLGLYDPVRDFWTNGLADAGKVPDNGATRELQIALIKGWVESMFVNIPLFGIRLSVNDVWFIGTAALCILEIWRFYGSRRENHLIGRLFYDAKCEDARTRSFVFYGVWGTQVFATLTDDDSPFDSIDPAPPGDRKVSWLDNAIVWLSSFWRAMNAPWQWIFGRKVLPAIRDLVWLLYYLPAIVIAFIAVIDILSVFAWPSIFRTGHEFLWVHNAKMGASMMTVVYIVEDFVMFAFAFLAAALIRMSNRYQDGTIQLLRDAAAKGWGVILPGAPSERVGTDVAPEQGLL